MKNWKAVLGIALAASLAASCTQDRGNERWATTENTNAKIDWDKVNEAYRNAKGPEDFEAKVNEIYEGDEVVSISVKDADDKSQVVTGFFDKNKSGTAEDDEKIFTITRTVADENAQYQMAGHGRHYGHYHSPFWTLASGMMLGSMISNWSRPGYAARSYSTSAARTSTLRTQRNAYRAKNPSRFSRSKASRSGRNYGSGKGNTPRRSSSRRSSGGGFGIAERPRRKRKPVRLTA